MVCERKSAVYANIGAGDKARGLWCGEEHRSADQFFGTTKALHRRMTQNLLSALCGAAIFVEQQATVLFSWEKSWGQGINANTLP